MAEPVLALDDLTVRFRLRRGELTAVDGVSFTVHRGETFGLVGESGSGKSVTARSIMRLIPDPPGEIPRGRIVFEGRDVLELERRRDARAARPAHRHGVPGADERAQPGVHRVRRRSPTRCAPISACRRQEARERVVELLVAGRHSLAAASGSTATCTSSPAACASA